VIDEPRVVGDDEPEILRAASDPLSLLLRADEPLALTAAEAGHSQVASDGTAMLNA
jgi:hypothetical protein